MAKKVRIILSNSRSRVAGKLKTILKLHNTLKIKSPGYFFSEAWRERRWDGYVRYVTENGTFATGYLYQLIEELQKQKIKYTIEDGRDTFKAIHKVKELGGLKLRDYQLKAVKAFINNRFEGITFHRGILHEATNAGKNLIAAAIFASFSSKRKGIFLIDSKTIFTQALKELGELLPGEVGRFDSYKQDITKRVTICMAQTLATRAKGNIRVRNWLANQDIVIVDECDTVATRKDTKYIANICYNAPVRLGMSGTPLHHKDKTRNQEVINFFGKILHTTTNKQLVDGGHSSKPTITFVPGNTDISMPKDFQGEYEYGIIRNRARNKTVWSIARKGVKKGPVVILIKYHKHIKYLMKRIPDSLLEGCQVESVHHKTKGRDNILKRFNQNKIDVLIASMIIRRGLNLKLMRSLINAAGGDSHSNTLQILGRGLRKEKGKKEEIDIWDFLDKGVYLRRHSTHRVRYYKQEGFPVKEITK